MSDEKSKANLTALVKSMVSALVDEPEAVDVKDFLEGDTKVLELRVAKPDLGKVIGKQGRTARSLRTILSAASVKMGQRVVLEIME